MQHLSNIFWLFGKELKSVLGDPVMVILILWSFVVAVMLEASGAGDTVRNAAIAVVDRYMHGLFTGDVATIRDCLDDLFQARRKNTLNDPTYAAFLIDRYDGATYRIRDVAAQPNGGTIVDVEIIYRSDETVVIRLMLNRRNQIVDEILL